MTSLPRDYDAWKTDSGREDDDRYSDQRADELGFDDGEALQRPLGKPRYPVTRPGGTCPECDGFKEIQARAWSDDAEGYIDEWVTCEVCNGHGTLQD